MNTATGLCRTTAPSGRRGRTLWTSSPSWQTSSRNANKGSLTTDPPTGEWGLCWRAGGNWHGAGKVGQGWGHLLLVEGVLAEKTFVCLSNHCGRQMFGRYNCQSILGPTSNRGGGPREVNYPLLEPHHHQVQPRHHVQTCLWADLSCPQIMHL